MKQYHNLLEKVLNIGTTKMDRTGTGTKSVFGTQSRYFLTNGFPLVTTKRVYFPAIVHELLWFIAGDTNVKYLQDNGVNIWNEWADAEGNLGPVYGAQWRRWNTADGTTIDQLAEVIHLLKTDPDSRRIIINAWNVGELSKMVLPPCHCFVQFYTIPMSNEERYHKYLFSLGMTTAEADDVIANKMWHVSMGTTDEAHTKALDNLGVPSRKLSCQLYQRSADLFLGVPFNIASYSLFTHMLAQVTNMVPYEFVHTIGDAHIYSNHEEQVREQLTREARPLPTLVLNTAVSNIDDFKYEDVTLYNYNPHGKIKAPIAV